MIYGEKDGTSMFEDAFDTKELMAADDEWWDSLSMEEQLRSFRQICKLIHKGDVQQRASYRGVLYDVFGWDAGAYGDGLMHYMTIHNLIYAGLDAQNKT